ncbi:interleukin-27 subunit beta-like [Stegostoma tigrinum]|uniref:interleukin-27 subunit beta-like n=1 Tax=Stegostoma tigrinum TaxID=3053191 RepID=UPI00202B1AFC|nr:interleukin-27 subunit beta-like [Stegostoma tigrinum]XP_048415379.1 interleukin-27 subunit beta-like [Stegostoma tigrinum]XP_048415380.1 interleukin-27 subunit beta-like [Stegostoma tigrinum]XP_059494535.1 interleukin-27 subunit beta-like [Stegostoma tigrinum]XP_059494536.1 interleukin-27 subunit beta-like [Stegostoma tigrinum]
MYLRLTVILGAVMMLLHIIGITVGQAIGDDIVTQYGQIGASVTLTCGNIDNGAVEWQLNDSKIIQTSNVELTRTKLTLFNIDVSQEGQYRCRNLESGKTYRTISLMLGYPPGKPRVTCRSVRYPLNVVCLWKLENQTYLPTRLNVLYRYGAEDVNQCSAEEVLQGNCTIEGIKLFSKIPYTVKVTATNPLGSRSTITQFIVEKIIKPDPPTKVSVSPIPNQPKKLLLQWKPPATWPDPSLFLLKYRIMYWPEGSTRYQMIEINDQASYILSGLRSKALYFAKIAAKDFVDNGMYSDWSPTVSARLWSN